MPVPASRVGYLHQTAMDEASGGVVTHAHTVRGCGPAVRGWVETHFTQPTHSQLAAHARAVCAALEAASAPFPLEASAVVAIAKVTVRTDVARGEAAVRKAAAFAEAARVAADTPLPSDAAVSVEVVQKKAKEALAGVKAAERRVRQRK